jgi:hypothetical protein
MPSQRCQFVLDHFELMLDGTPLGHTFLLRSSLRFPFCLCPSRSLSTPEDPQQTRTYRCCDHGGAGHNGRHYTDVLEHYFAPFPEDLVQSMSLGAYLAVTP